MVNAGFVNFISKFKKRTSTRLPLPGAASGTNHRHQISALFYPQNAGKEGMSDGA